MDRTLLDHEVILRAAMAQHAKALERAHRKLAVTAMKVSLAAKDSSLVTRALGVANSCAYYAAGSAHAAEAELSAAKDRYNSNAAERTKRRRLSGAESECESASTKKECP